MDATPAPRSVQTASRGASHGRHRPDAGLRRVTIVATVSPSEETGLIHSLQAFRSMLAMGAPLQMLGTEEIQIPEDQVCMFDELQLVFPHLAQEHLRREHKACVGVHSAVANLLV